MFGFGTSSKSFIKVRAIYGNTSRIFRINEGFEKLSKQNTTTQTKPNNQQTNSGSQPNNTTTQTKQAEVEQEHLRATGKIRKMHATA